MFRQRAPRIYQETADGRRSIGGRFIASGRRNEFLLELGKYRKELPLTIDPVLEFSTYLGGENDDRITVVSDQFVAGTTSSVALFGASPARRRTRDVFVRGAALYSSSSGFQAGTIVLGGSGDEEVTAGGTSTLSMNQVCVAGWTSSRDFPVSSSSLSYAGGASDGFITCFPRQTYGNFNVSMLIGGHGEDRVTALANGGIWVAAAGVTDSTDLPVANAFQANLAGGKDAFVFASYPGGKTSFLSYLGGSGDDTALAVAPVMSNRFYVAGETRSPDFPLSGSEPGERRGDSDGFMAQIDATQAALVSSRLIGGTGEDRIQAMAILRPAYTTVGAVIAAAGATTSADFPLVNPVQERLNGETDAFALRMALSDQAMQLSTYLGGSAHDEATGVSGDANGNMLVAGWTRSSDLAAVDALQPSHGGGEDGFLAYISNDNRVRQLTYFGGAGDDRISSVAAVSSASFGTYVARVGGSTTSADLPLAKPWQSEKDDRMDGFVAEIGTSYLTGPDRIALGKDLATRVSLSAAQTSRPPLTLSSSDPSKVRFVSNQSGEVTVTGVWEAEIEALSDSGEVEITATAPGFTPKTILVKLSPAGVYSALQAKIVITTWNTPILVSAYLAAWNELTDTPEGYGYLRRGVEPLKITWKSSDESVVKTVRENAQWSLHPAGPGTATVTLECDQFPVKRGQSEIVVNRPSLTVTNATIGKDLQRPLTVGFQTGSSYSSAVARGTVTARSSDPARLLLSARDQQPGSESVALPATAYGITMYAQALASEGEVRVIVSSPEVSEEREIVVSLDRSVVLPSVTSDQVQVGSTFDVFARLRPESEAGTSVSTVTFSLRPGAPPLRLRISSSNQDVVQPEVTSLVLGPGSTAFRLRALAPGNSEITLSSDSPDVLAQGGVTVSVSQPGSATFYGLPNVYLGKDLQTLFTVRVSAPRDTEVVITTDDPALALVSSDNTSPGQPELRLRLIRDEVRFYAEGLLSSGETKVRLKIPGGQEAESTLTLAPSGFAFKSDSTAVPFHAAGGSIGLAAYALDDLTLIPLVQQGLRPAARVDVKLKLEGDAVALKSTSVSFPADDAPVAYTIRDRGESVISLETPPGFTAPSRRARFKVRVVNSVLTAGSPIAAKDALTGADLRVDSDYSRAVDISVESDDPSRLLVASADGPAAASATVRTPGRISFHGLADSGTVTVRLRAPGVEPVDLAVPLYPVRLTIDGVTEGLVEMLSLSGSKEWRLTLSAAGRSVTPRPGSDAVRIQLVSSNERVVRIAPTSVEIRPGSSSAPVQVTARAPGSAEIQVQAPAGMEVARERIPVTVRAPRLTIPPVAIARNLQGAVRIRSEAGALPDNAIVTATSDSPDRLLLSRSRTGGGSASVAVAFQAGNSASEPFYLLALSDSGEATLRLAAEGFADSTASVLLAQPAVVFSNPGTVTLTKGATQPAYLYIAPLTAESSQYAALEDTSIRPGSPDVVVPVVIEDAAVVSAPSEVVFKAGQNPAQSFAVKALAAGRTTITLGVPEGFADTGSRRSTTYHVALPPLPVSCPEAYVGRDAQISCAVNVPAGVRVTASTVDSSRVLLSFDGKTVGSDAVRSAGASERLYIQGLAADGSAEVVLRAPEYLDQALTIRLSPSTFNLDSNFSGSPIQLNKGASTDLRVTFVRLTAEGSMYAAELRPGVGPFQITLSSSLPDVVRLTPGTLTFAAGDSGSKTVRLEALAPGTATVRISTPEGFANPPKTTLLFEVR